MDHNSVRRQPDKTDKNTGQRCFLNAGIRAVKGEENKRKFILSFSSEEPYERWFGPEILDHSDGCVDLTRLNSIGVTLFNHKADNVIAKINKAWVEDSRGYAEIDFDDDDFSEMIYKKVKNGTLKGVSVGYRVLVWEEVKANAKSIDGRFTGPCSIAKRWVSLEISIVSVPADATVGVGRNYFPVAEEACCLYEKQLQININMYGGTK